jgi:small nuclear ribonucleoprotein (snRNP)-like protein
LQLVELKNGETYNGNLVSVDIFMNLQLSDVICTSKVSVRKSPSGMGPQQTAGGSRKRVALFSGLSLFAGGRQVLEVARGVRARAIDQVPSHP